MKTQANAEIQPYEPSGTEVRIHWNIEQLQKEDISGEIITYWQADEVLCNTYDDRSTLIEKIIASQYSAGREFATINNKDEDPQAYAAYQALRMQAKSLADGWIAIR